MREMFVLVADVKNSIASAPNSADELKFPISSSITRAARSTYASTEVHVDVE